MSVSMVITVTTKSTVRLHYVTWTNSFWLKFAQKEGFTVQTRVTCTLYVRKEGSNPGTGLGELQRDILKSITTIISRVTSNRSMKV